MPTRIMATPSDTVAAEPLAIHGGLKLVTEPPVDRHERISNESKERVMALLAAGITSIPGNAGIVGEFENAFAAMVGTKYALSMNSGTASLHSAYFALGIGPGDEVLVPTYTWHATITPILHCAATPVFCDIDPSTLTIDPADILRKITPRTKAICVVHVFGNVCDMDRIAAIAIEHGLAIVEDCSHAHGASWKGKKVGSIGDIGCFSLQGAKVINGGEGGVATTDRADLMDRMILLGHNGREKVQGDPAVESVGDMSMGAKYRVHPYAVALAFGDLNRLEEVNDKRTRNYEYLNDRLRDCPGLEVIDPLPGAKRAGYLELKFKLTRDVLVVADRQRITDAIQAEGAPLIADRYSGFNYTYGLLHTAPLFRSFDRHSVGGCFYDPTLTEDQEKALQAIPSLPVAEDLARRLVSFPAFVDVTEQSLQQIADSVTKVLSQVHAL